MAQYLTTTARAMRKAALKNISSDVVNDFLDMAQDAIEKDCDRKFEYASYTGVYNGNGSKRLWLKNAPITSITSVTITEDDGTEESLTVATDLVFEAANGAVEFGPDNVSSYELWPEGFQNISVTYVGGYSTIPDALQEACALKALIFFAHSGADLNAALQAENIGNASKTRTGESILEEWESNYRRLIQPYRRMEFV